MEASDYDAHGFGANSSARVFLNSDKAVFEAIAAAVKRRAAIRVDRW